MIHMAPRWSRCRSSVAIGAITFTGLGHRLRQAQRQLVMSGKPIMLPSRHLINLGSRALLLVLLIVGW